MDTADIGMRMRKRIARMAKLWELGFGDDELRVVCKNMVALPYLSVSVVCASLSIDRCSTDRQSAILGVIDSFVGFDVSISSQADFI